jgi:hypothetical protein
MPASISYTRNLQFDHLNCSTCTRAFGALSTFATLEFEALDLNTRLQPRRSSYHASLASSKAIRTCEIGQLTHTRACSNQLGELICIAQLQPFQLACMLGERFKHVWAVYAKAALEFQHIA